MANLEKNKFGLLGRDIGYSFSSGYFSNKFKKLGLDNYEYLNFDLENCSQIIDIIEKDSTIKGFNVTIPYKIDIIKHLDTISDDAKKIDAVNVVKISNGKLKGFNSDHYGFRESIKPFLNKDHYKALILGTGGASKAIKFAFDEMNIKYMSVSRKGLEDTYSYESLNEEIINDNKIIVNCTPLGTYPNMDLCPDIPYNGIGKGHLLFDLVYNPPESKFLKEGKKRGAQLVNGSKMLELQAERSWEIWNLNG